MPAWSTPVQHYCCKIDAPYTLPFRVQFAQARFIDSWDAHRPAGCSEIEVKIIDGLGTAGSSGGGRAAVAASPLCLQTCGPKSHSYLLQSPAHSTTLLARPKPEIGDNTTRPTPCALLSLALSFTSDHPAACPPSFPSRLQLATRLAHKNDM